MWLGEVVTLAVGTLIVLVLIHLAVFWVTQKQQPTVVYVQAPPQVPAFVQPQETQVVNVPAMEPQVQVSTAVPDLPRRHGE